MEILNNVEFLLCLIITAQIIAIVIVSITKNGTNETYKKKVFEETNKPKKRPEFQKINKAEAIKKAFENSKGRI